MAKALVMIVEVLDKTYKKTHSKDYCQQILLK